MKKLLDIDKFPTYEIEELMLEFSEKFLLEQSESEHKVISKNSNIFQNSFEISEEKHSQTNKQVENDEFLLNANFTLKEASSKYIHSFFDKNHPKDSIQVGGPMPQIQSLKMLNKEKQTENVSQNDNEGSGVKKSVSYGFLKNQAQHP